MSYIDFLSSLHKQTKRNYLARVKEFPKAAAAKVAKQFSDQYWDGDRKYGYGGYYYDGRWLPVATAIADHYQLKAGDRILDVGCGKAFLLHEFTKILPEVEVFGLDISRYAIENAKIGDQSRLFIGSATDLPFDTDYFDLVISITTLHNLYCNELDLALREIERVGKGNKYIVVESYRNEEEKANLLYWQLTCESFYTPEEWDWWFQHCRYKGDHSFIYFE